MVFLKHAFLNAFMKNVFVDGVNVEGASTASSKFCEWVQVGNDICILHRKCQVKANSSSWFLAACAAAIAHRNNVFRLYQQNKYSESKVKFKKVSNCRKRVI